MVEVGVLEKPKRCDGGGVVGVLEYEHPKRCDGDGDEDGGAPLKG